MCRAPFAWLTTRRHPCFSPRHSTRKAIPSYAATKFSSRGATNTMMSSSRRALIATVFVLIAAAALPAAADFQVGVNGNTIWVRIGAGLTGKQCCRGASLDEEQTGANCSVACPANPEDYLEFSCNSLGTHVVYGCVLGAETNYEYVCESKTVEVTVPAPTSCPLFDFYTVGNRALTHKYGVGDSYSAGQDADSEMTLKLRARRAPAGSTVYLRVADPPDSAPYGLPAPRPRNDNADSGAGTIFGGKTATVVLPATGILNVPLRTTDTVAGDNYEVLASADEALHTDPDFVCNATTNCQKTPVITAWKRIYVETDRMFRHGAYLTADVAPCAAAPCYLPLSNLRGLGRGDMLRLIHAPRTGLVGPQLFYSEDVSIVRVEKSRGRVEVTPYARSYFGPDQDSGGAVRGFLADAVGVVTGDDEQDFFSPNPNLIVPLFDGTFVEFLFLNDDPVPFVPYEQQIGGGGEPGSEAREVARRWFHNFDRPNHQHLLGAGTGFDAGVKGLTTAKIGTNWSWIFVESVAASSPRRGGREWVFNGEVASHEMAHQWQVNPGPNTGGHCAEFRWNSTMLYCTMHSDYGVAADPCGGTCPEFYDGQVGFHYVSGTNSEYTYIRRRPDPVPQLP